MRQEKLAESTKKFNETRKKTKKKFFFHAIHFHSLAVLKIYLKKREKIQYNKINGDNDKKCIHTNVLARKKAKIKNKNKCGRVHDSDK